MILDISILVQPGTPEWPGDVPFSCGWSARIAQGASVNLSHVAGSPHMGTHADAPLHVRDGWPASDQLPLEPFLGPVTVLDVTRAPAGTLALDADDPRLEGCERLLLRTDRRQLSVVSRGLGALFGPAHRDRGGHGGRNGN